MMNAIISANAGVAVLVDKDKPMFIYSESSPKFIPACQSDIACLLRDFNDIKFYDDVKNKRNTLKLLKNERNKEEALQFILIALDEDLSDELRQDAIIVLEGLLKLPDIYEALENIFCAHEFPGNLQIDKSLDLCKKKKTSKTKNFLELLNKYQDSILSVRKSWEMIPLVFFEYEEKNYYRKKFIEEGVFRDLVRILFNQKNTDQFIMNCLLKPDICALDNIKKMVQLQ